MSTSAGSRPPARIQPTRQQLDELIDLMQRMLALPPTPTEEDPGPPAETPARSPRLDPTGASVAPPHVSPNAFAPPATIEDDRLADPEPRLEGPARHGEDPAVMSITLVPIPSPPPATPPASDTGVTPRPKTLSPLSQPAAGSTQGPRVGFWLGPLVGVNRAFDAGTAWMGAPGRWLRSPQGRALLGWSGWLLLTAAVAWYLAEGMGWTW
jgi:hypothetical protein